MHTVSAAYQTAIAQGKVRMAELYDVLLANGTTHRYTNHAGDIVWNAGSDIYTAIPIERSPIQYNTDGSFDECTLDIGIISGALRANLKSNILDAAQVTIKLIRWDATYAADEEIILFVGIADIGFNSSDLTIRLLSKNDSMTIVVPRHIYQPGCNHHLFDATCGLTRADYLYAGTATGGTTTTLVDTTAGTIYKVSFDAGDSGNPVEIGDALVGNDGTPGDGVCVNIVYLTAATGTIWYVENTHQFVNDEIITGGGNTVTVNGTPAADTAYYEMGELEMLTGDNAGESRPILSVNGSTRTVFWPFPNAVSAVDTYNIYPGCDGRAAETCLATFNNTIQWRGFPYIKPALGILYS